MPGYDFDLFVIGAGSGGVRAARIAAQNGARVAIAEEDRIGGTCVIRGCVPKKIMVLASRFHDAFHDARGYGWSFPLEPVFSWEDLKSARDNEVARLSEIYENNLIKAGVLVFRGRAVIVDKNRVKMDGTETSFTAKQVLVAVGDRPVLPPVEGADLGITSDDFFNLPHQPETILIVGGGYIAVEFACLLKRLGTRVTLVHRRNTVLASFDADIQQELLHALRKDEIDLRLETRVARVESLDVNGKSRRRVTFHDGSVADFDAVLFATGRKAHTEGLGVEQAGIALGEGGIVSVDADGHTAEPFLHAVGDVTGGPKLTPVAIREGHAFADSTFSDHPWTPDLHTVATAIFTTPEIGVVGLSEQEALGQGLTIDVYKTRFRSLKHVHTERQERTLLKLVVDSTSGVVLGVHIVGEEAGELIQLAAVIVQNKLTKTALDATVPVHPTIAEELVTLREFERKTP